MTVQQEQSRGQNSAYRSGCQHSALFPANCLNNSSALRFPLTLPATGCAAREWMAVAPEPDRAEEWIRMTPAKAHRFAESLIPSPHYQRIESQHNRRTVSERSTAAHFNCVLASLQAISGRDHPLIVNISERAAALRSEV